MFWLIVAALIFVFWLLPMIVAVIGSIIGALFENGNSGCAWIFIVAVIIVLLALVF